MGKSNIEWTEQTWNPIVGCSILTPGCARCYAMGMAGRIEAMNAALRAQGKRGAEHYAGTTKKVKGRSVWTGLLAQAPDHIFHEPLKRRVPTTYFVNSMSDLFHEDCPDETIDDVFAVMAATQQHRYQVLTKRSLRMRDYMANVEREALWMNALARLIERAHITKPLPILCQRAPWLPLPNVWLGVSTERQQEANARIPHLLDTPAAVRFISAEPLIGPIDLTAIEAPDKVEGERWTFNALTNGDYYTQWSETLLGEPRRSGGDGPYREHALDWVIVGGESGSVDEVRDFDLRWARHIAEQCKAADVRCFIKQLGSNPVDSDLVTEGDAPAVHLKDKKGGDPAEWPAELRIREVPGDVEKIAA